MRDVTYSVSARGKKPTEPVISWLYNYKLPLDSIDSVFGFPDIPCPFYGGRNFYVNPWATRQRVVELSIDDIQSLYLKGIGFRIPLTNHFVTREEYEVGQSVLNRFHRMGNSVIVYNDNLARWIRDDFPLYRVEASVIKGVKTHEKIREVLDLYDSLVPAFEVHEDLEFLKAVPMGLRPRIRLFANVSCERGCPSRICYSFFSKVNKNPRDTSDLGPSCSREVERLALMRQRHGGITLYDVDAFRQMGYTRFKMLREDPARPGQAF